MTIEELYELRKEVLENKTKFRELNSKYNKLLEKLFNKKGKEKKVTEEEFIKGESYIWYWGRFFVLMILTLIFKIPNDITLLCILGNLGIKIFDEYVILPRLWIKKQLKGRNESKEEKEQRELYDEVSNARSLYHQLNKQYEEELGKLSCDEEKEYLQFLESLGVSFDGEEREKEENIVMISTDVKMLEKVNGEKGELV